MRAEAIRPGVTFEWPHTPDFTVCSRMVIDRIEEGYAWVHYEDTNTINRLSVPAILRHGRLALTTGMEVEHLKRLVRQYADPTEMADQRDANIAIALGTDDVEVYRNAIEARMP